MNLEILSPEKKIYEGIVKSVVFPGSEGCFGVLDQHAPLISNLAKGEITIIDNENRTHQIQISGGVVEVLTGKVSVLVD
jgi:F-type H+-transporting ATPase subunit epsilon